MIEIKTIRSPEDFQKAQVLVDEYLSDITEALSKMCFDPDAGEPILDKEEKGLSAYYSTPARGMFLLGLENDNPIACGGIRKLTDTTVEMRRLYVRSLARGRGIARRIIERLIKEAYILGYSDIKLSSHSYMKEAISLYALFGFTTTEPYHNNPLRGDQFFQLKLNTKNQII